MAVTLNREQIDKEIETAVRLAREVKRPRGVHDVRVEPDEDQDGNPMLVVLVDVDDEADPSDERLDELLDYENRIWSKITDGGLASWPLIRLVPRIQAE